MMNMEETKKKARIGALDLFILVAVVVCIGGLLLRMFVRSDAVATNTAVMEDYVVSFQVRNIRASSVKYFNRDDLFFVNDGGERLGTLLSVSDLPAQRYYTDIDGKTILVMNESTDDRTKRVDLEADLLVSGSVDGNGRFLLNGTTYLGVNKDFYIRSKNIIVNIKITSIAKAADA